MSKNSNKTSRSFGERGENLKDPIYIQQPDDHSCALRSQQIVLRDFGIDIPFDVLEQYALEAGVYSEDGTYTYDIGKVLEMAGVGMHQVYGSTIYDITNELAQGHRIIVTVDADELWYNDSVVNKTTNWLKDVFGKQGGNHALIVAGVDVNPDHPSDVKVILTDPGSGDLRIEYPLDQFMDAWQDSNCFMVATDEAASYQYDASTGMEVPSNFYTEFAYNQFVANNSYVLNPDKINVPDDYQAAYNGHLNMIGDVKYEVFKDNYDKLMSARTSEEPARTIGIKSAVNSLIDDLKNMFGHHAQSETGPGTGGDNSGTGGNNSGTGGDNSGTDGDNSSTDGDNSGTDGDNSGHGDNYSDNGDDYSDNDPSMCH